MDVEGGKRDRERQKKQRQTDSERDIQGDTKSDRDRQRKTQRETEIDREGQKETERDRQIETEKQRQTDSEQDIICVRILNSYFKIRLLGLQRNYTLSNLLSKTKIILEKHGIFLESDKTSLTVEDFCGYWTQCKCDKCTLSQLLVLLIAMV